MRLTTLFIFSLFAATCICQSFGDANATWIFDHNGGTRIGITKVAYSHDTIVNDSAIRVFKKTAIRKLDSSFEVFMLQAVYIEDINGVIQFSEDLEHFDTLYNFNAAVGDVWKIPKRNSDGNETGFFLECKVLNRFTSTLNGIDTPCLGVLNGASTMIDTICQGIGSRLKYILPFDDEAVAADGGEGGLLRCYSSDIVGVIQYTHPGALWGGHFQTLNTIVTH